MKVQRLLALLLITVAVLSQASYAQVGSRGGGKTKESDLRYFIGMMDPYFQSEEGKKTFPEVVAYNAAHTPDESFHHLINKIHPVVIDGPVQDDFQDSRDCVADFSDKKNLFFTCNGNAMPEMKLENHPSLYRIVLHELFVIAGIEKPISKAIPSDYSISYRITTNVHLETQQAWIPGKGDPIHYSQPVYFEDYMRIADCKTTDAITTQNIQILQRTQYVGEPESVKENGLIVFGYWIDEVKLVANDDHSLTMQFKEIGDSCIFNRAILSPDKNTLTLKLANVVYTCVTNR